MCLHHLCRFRKPSTSHPATQPAPPPSDPPTRRDAGTQTTSTSYAHASTQTDETATCPVGIHAPYVEPRAPLSSIETRLGLPTESARPPGSITSSEPSHDQIAHGESSRGIFEPEPHVPRPLAEPTPTQTATSPPLSPWFMRKR